MNHEMFSGELEKGNFLGSMDFLADAYDAVLKTTSPLAYKLHTSPSGIQVLAFGCNSPDYTTRFLNGEFKLVSSENHKVVDFISTKVNSKFLINEAAIVLFEPLLVELKELEDEIIYKPLIVTGQSVGGYVAILFALWLNYVISTKGFDSSKKAMIRPICITFGSPLVGDQALQHAISERPLWKSNFLNVVWKTDPIPSFRSSSGEYKPFGTYLFCTQSGGFTCFEDDDAILEVLGATASSSTGNLQMQDYGNDLMLIKEKVFYRGVSDMGEPRFSSLKAGIKLQLMEIDLVDTSALIEKIESKQAKMIRKRKSRYDPARKLNDVKLHMVCMERYMMTRRPTVSYYDTYKNAKNIKEIENQQEVVKSQRYLNQYWSDFVEKKNQMPQEEGANLRRRWLYGGNIYRKIVEPLDVAEFYKNGKKNYIAQRPHHYKLLEKWLSEDKKDLKPNPRTNNAASLTEDSCFWAHVEEALISLQELINRGSNNNAANTEKELEQFEAYLMQAINDNSVSSDIFLEESSLMKWWSEYKTYKGASYTSQFAEYMNNGAYKLYQ
ncbi:alpha/Beta hydrolase fold protein [Artemisia annua]|uniref:Alpha/Beta hydrolase fold protein n=1 Tax=Artemisia annua TaxID=35608 RepID=A0A2U1M8L7_ARTAN|nr:alpha/Beta hydrolase fold protein [Artemisia annua]